ncbi:MAG: nickel pincer cofactor biosynthesis protein LarC [Pseudanabaena sp. ELA645]
MAANIAYLDCPTGIAGDMCLGALVSAGVPLAYLQNIIQKLGLDREVKLWTETVYRCGIQATKLHVELISGEINPIEDSPTFAIKDPHEHEHSHNHPHEDHTHADHADHTHSHDAPTSNSHAHPVHRHLPEIEKIIRDAKLPSPIEVWSLATFKELAIAEGLVHGIAPEAVHFHEVGAVDAIVDIVCTCAGFAWLEVEKIYCSALPTGGGYVNCDHGKMPVPAPATLKLWELHEVPVFDNGIRKELVTPTGAAIAVTLCEKFGEVPLMKIKKVGLGAGTQDLEIPNALRLWVGKSKKKKL